ncbi:hypothetical protein A6V39_00425 [Candidatus Mycoplasma haematobovis]|uniref:Uncharacterized protein n=1 Tax=Candidatus Mycoplasma haematobovis TaxID=432608 RepID=A0A1A9QEX5_9MOLU|nr:hypothetical protein [Candidatus Mycoplasma haematobovis]OAL10515.1 hypothetical protein A6V39_00425 [Candidatus Mycoplasma haematobovis]
MNLKYLAIGSASVSAIGGVSYAGFVFMKPKNLREDLAKNNYKTLSTDKGKDKETWTKLLTEYEKNQNPKIEGLDFAGSSDTDAKVEKLQEACKKLYETKKDAQNYSTLLDTAKAWCISDSKKLTNTAATVASADRSAGAGVVPGVPGSTTSGGGH